MSESSFSVIYPKIGAGPLVVPSTFGYVSGYQKPKDITEQIHILERVFPVLSHKPTIVPIDARAVPDGAEGWFVIPPWPLIAPTYTGAILVALEGLEEVKGVKVYQYCYGKIGSRNLSRNFTTERALRSLGGDEEHWWETMFTIPAQLGFHHRGASPYWVKRALREHEFGLGLFEGIIMLITHPERLDGNDDLWIEFPGDNFSPNPEGESIHTPFINIIDGEIGVGTSLSNIPGARYGSATWFLP